MDKEKLKQEWLHEESIAHIKGWDFSHIDDRYEEENDLPWDYEAVIREYLKPEHKLLDIDTGGGEFLLSLKHPFENTSATEAYPPNVKLCKETLLPLGIDFRCTDENKPLPFDDDSFDIVINRHGSFCAGELHRTIKRGGLFITQQVGSQNDRELVEFLQPGTKALFPDQHLTYVREIFERNGFEILKADEAFRPIKFYDVGALVWFARIIEWEFIDFSVEKYLDNLYRAQEVIDKKGVIEGKIHRFMLVARKK